MTFQKIHLLYKEKYSFLYQLHYVSSKPNVYKMSYDNRGYRPPCGFVERLELRKAVSNVPRHEKTGFLPMRKQRRRSASQ